MSRIIGILVLLALQGIAQDRGSPWMNKDLKVGDLVFKPVHIHYSHRDCRNESDKVYSKTNGVYFACVNHQEVCNRSPHSIPQRLIDAFEREIREFKESVEQSQREAKQRMAEARAKDEAEWGPRRAADARMREARMSTRAGTASIGRGSAVPVAPALTPAPQSVKLPDERVEEIVTGTTREELIRKFGPPHSRISGDSERLTYLLTSGASLKFDLEDNVVTNIRIIPK